MKTAYKLTAQNNKTLGNSLWVPGEWKETDGNGNLCGKGWLHAYSDPYIAAFMNVIHARIEKPKIWKAEVRGKFLDGRGLKCGYTKMRLIKEIKLPVISSEKRVRVAVYLATLAGYTGADFQEWASRWLTEEDNSEQSAQAVHKAIGSEGPPAYASREIANATWAAKCSVHAALKFIESKHKKSVSGLINVISARTAVRAADAGADFDLAKIIKNM